MKIRLIADPVACLCLLAMTSEQWKALRQQLDGEFVVQIPIFCLEVAQAKLSSKVKMEEFTLRCALFITDWQVPERIELSKEVWPDEAFTGVKAAVATLTQYVSNSQSTAILTMRVADYDGLPDDKLFTVGNDGVIGRAADAEDHGN